MGLVAVAVSLDLVLVPGTGVGEPGEWWGAGLEVLGLVVAQEAAGLEAVERGVPLCESSSIRGGFRLI